MNQEVLFESTMDSGSLCILIISPDNYVEYISPALSKIFGKMKEEMIGKPLNEVGLSSIIVDLLNVNIRPVMEGLEYNRIEIGPEYLGGNQIFECEISKLTHKTGEYLGIKVVFEDITAKEDLLFTNNHLDSMIEKIQKTNDIDKIIPQVLKDIATAFNKDIITLMFRQDDYWFVKYSYDSHDVSKIAVYLEEQLTLARIIQKHKDVFILNDGIDKYDLFMKRLISKWGIHFFLAIPLHIQGDVFAILTMASRSQTTSFPQYQLDNVRRTASILSLAFSEDRYIWSRESEIPPPLNKYLDEMPIGAAILDGSTGKNIWSNDIYNTIIPSKYQGDKITQMPFYHISQEMKDRHPEDIIPLAITTRSQIPYGLLQERNKKGILRYWQVVFLPFFQKDQSSKVLCLIVDVTEWEKANNKNTRLVHAIQEEQYRVRTLLDSVPVGIYISDAEGQILEISQMGKKIWGHRPLPRNIKGYGEYVGIWPHSNQRLQVDDWPIVKAVRKGETTIGEIIDYKNFDDKNGTIINSAAPIRNRHGDVIGAVEIDQDITELKTLERNLEATKAYLEAIINQMPVGVAIAEAPSGQITICNHEFKRMFPSLTEIPSSVDQYTYLGLLDVDDMKPLSAEEYPLAIALRENRTVNHHQAMIRKSNGSNITVLSSASPVRTKDRRIEGAVTILTDITRQKEIEQKLEKQTQDLIRFNSDMQRFAYVTSNELRESLKSITNYLTLIDKNSS